MVKNLGPSICVLIMSLDILAGVLGIEAEIETNKVSHVKVLMVDCGGASHKAFNLGVAAVVLLAAAHVIANFFGGLVCICTEEQFTKASANKQLAALFLLLSWVILAITFPMLIVGTMANSKSKAYCGLSHPRLMSIGGVLCFIHGLFCVSYYVSASASASAEEEARKSVHGTSVNALKAAGQQQVA